MGDLNLRSLFGDDVTEYKCPNCGHQVRFKTLDALEHGVKVDCPGCGQTINIEPEAEAGQSLRQANKALRDFEKTVKRFGK